MDHESQKPGQQPAEKKKSPRSGPSVVWYAIAIAIGALLVFGLAWTTPTTARIHYLEFIRLAKQGAPEKNPNAAITVLEENRGKPERVKYSHLAHLRVGPTEIRGTVTREVLEPTHKPAETEMAFRTTHWGLDGENGQQLVNLLLDNGFGGVKVDATSGFWRDWGSPLLFLLITIPLVIFMVRRLGGAGSAMAFGRSRGRLYAQEDLGVTFKDVAGIDEAVEELQEVVEFLATPEKYRCLGGRIPKGVLLVGPPGTGKTLLAKAVAGEAGVPFFSLSGSDFVEMFVGVGAARVRDMFQQAQSRAPCIVFIDELDALGKTRGTSMVGGHDEREQTLNALLVEMDGFSSNSGVIVMAATNRPETLDPALLRPGRFDRHVLVDRPDVRGREEILKVHVQSVKLDESVDLKAVAAITSGFVGADLANLVNEAALLAARKNKATVTMKELNEGVERVTAGLEKKRRIMSDEEKHRVAYHEAAHALVAYSLPNTDPVHKVSIIPRGLAALGYTMQRPEGDRYLMTQSELEARIQVMLAGTLAEELIFEDVSTGAQNDLERATEVARSMVMDFGMSRLGRVNYRESNRSAFLAGAADQPRDTHHSEQTAREIDEEVKRIIDESLSKARRILESRQKALIALANELIETETIDTDELRRVVETNSPSPTIVPGTGDVVKRSSTAATESLPPSSEIGEALP